MYYLILEWENARLNERFRFCNRGLIDVKRVNTRNASSSHMFVFSLNRVSFFGFGP